MAIGNLQELIPAFFTGPNGQPLTPDQIAQRQEVAKSLLQQASDTSPNAGGWASVLAKGLQGGIAGYQQGRADDAAALNAKTDQANIEAGLGSIFGGGSQMPGGGIGGAFPSAVAQGASPTSGVATGTVTDAPQTVNIGGDKQEFINALLPAAIEESKRTGLDPRLIVAQAAQETGWGRSAPGNNFFGIKSHGQGGGQQLKTHEYVNGKRVNVSDSFRQYENPAASVSGYADFLLSNPRYKPMMAAGDLDSQLEALQASGYATDPNYSRSVGSIARSIPLPEMAAPDASMTAYAPQQQPAGGALASAPFASAGLPSYAAGAVDMGGTPQPVYDERGFRMDTVAPVPPQGPVPYAGPGATTDIPPYGSSGKGDRLPMPAAPAPNPMADPRNQLDLTTIPQGDGGGLTGQVAPNDPGMWGMGMDPNDPSTIPAMAGGTRDIIQGQSGGQFPQAPMQQPAGGVNPQIIASLLGPNSSPQARQVGALLIGQHQKQQEAMQAQQKSQQELARRQQVAQSMGIDPNAAMDVEAWKAAVARANRDRSTVTVGNTVLDANTMQPIYEGTPENPTSVKEYEYGVNTPGYFERQESLKRAGATNVNVGPQGIDYGSPPTSHAWARNEDGSVQIDERGAPVALPVGPAYAEQQSAEAEGAVRQDVQTIADAQKSETLMDATQSVLDIMDKATLPVTGTLSRPFALYSDTDAGRVRSYVSTLRSGVALGAMQRLKEASATGATGFGALSEKELEILISDIGALDPDTTEPDIFRKTVERIQSNARRTAESIRKNVSPERIAELGLQPFIDSFGADGGMPKPKSRAEMEALPSGTKFEDPDGNIRMRP